MNAADLKSVINLVVSKFTELLKKNHMLGVEALFRFPSREIKDQILCNYEVARGKHPQGAQDQER